jgi:hypothetical protein
MMKRFFAMGILTTNVLIANAAFVSPAKADSAVVQDQHDTLYYCTNANVNSAQECAISYCRNEGVGSCRLVWVSDNSSGYAVVARSRSTQHFSSNYASLRQAKLNALNSCQRHSSPNDVCEIILAFDDLSR